MGAQANAIAVDEYNTIRQHLAVGDISIADLVEETMKLLVFVVENNIGKKEQ